MKKIISIILSFVMAITAIPLFSAQEPIKALAAGENYSNGDLIEFGSYPQSRVTDNSTISALNSLSKTWVSYEYMSGNGDYGSAQPSDYMKYADVTYNGSKYRAVTFSTYRPTNTNYKSTTSTNTVKYQYRHSYYINNTYYFKYEPLKWKILDTSTGLVISKKIIDSQAYSDTLYYSGSAYYKDSSYSIYANNYYESTVRKWLNDDFYNTAFSLSEKKYINVTKLDNTSGYGKYDSKTSYDYVFLASYADARNSNYFPSDSWRMAFVTDYAECQGTSNNQGDNECSWRLRTAGESSTSAAYVASYGSTYCDNVGYVDSTGKGIRPCLELNLISGVSSPYNGSISNSLVADGTSEFKVYDSTSIAEGEAFSANGELNLALSSVNADYNSKSVSFDKSISVSNTGISNGITFSKSGYRDYIIPREVTTSTDYLEKASHNIYMAADTKDGKPYVSTVYAKDVSSSDDDSGKYAEVQHESLTIKKGKKYNVAISANLAGTNSATYYLSQDNSHKILNSTGLFSSEDLYSVFKENATIYAYVVAGGVTSEPVKLKLTKKASTELDNLTQSSTFNLLGQDSAKITISDSIPIVGGTNVSMDFIKLPLGVQIDNDIVRISLGVDVFKTKSTSSDAWGSEDKRETTGLWQNFKNECQSFNKLLEKSGDSWDNYKKWRTVSQFGSVAPIKETSNSFNAAVMGYIEGQLVNGKIQVTGYSGTVAVGFMLSHSQQFSIGPVPVYLYGEAGADASLAFTKAKMLNDDTVPFDFGLNLSIEPSLKVGGGAGVKGAASVGIYGKAALPFTNNFATKYRTLYLNGTFGVEAQLFCFKGNKDLLSGSVKIYDGYYGSTAKKSARRISLANALSESNDDEVVYSSMSRDYAEDTSSWLGSASTNSARRARAASQSSVSLKTLQSSVYNNSETQIVKFGDKMMMAWIEDCSDRDDNNRLRLVYSVYDASTNTWSDPKAVYDNGKLDSAPSLVSDGENVYIAWQKANKLITDDDGTIDTTDFLSSIEICYAEYDESSDSFINAKTVTNNSSYDYMPTLVADGDSVVLYYVENAENDLAAENSNTIYKYVVGGKTSSAATGLNYVANMDATASEMSYSADVDGDLSTTDDINVFTVSNGSVAQTSADESASANLVLKYGVLDGEETLFYADSTNLYYQKDGKTITVFDEEKTINGDLNILQNGDETILLWSQNSTAGTELYTCSCENGEWTAPVQLTEYDCLLSNVSAVYNNGQIVTSLDKTERTLSTDDDGNESYQSGQTDLCLLTIGNKTDISADITYIDESELVKGETTQIDVVVENLGTQPVSSIDFTITDTLGTSDTQTVSVDLPSGEMATVSVPYTVPDDYTSGTLSIEEYCDGDEDSTNNMATYSIGNTEFTATSLVTVSSQISQVFCSIPVVEQVASVITVQSLENVCVCGASTYAPTVLSSVRYSLVVVFAVK